MSTWLHTHGLPALGVPCPHPSTEVTSTPIPLTHQHPDFPPRHSGSSVAFIRHQQAMLPACPCQGHPCTDTGLLTSTDDGTPSPRLLWPLAAGQVQTEVWRPQEGTLALSHLPHTPQQLFCSPSRLHRLAEEKTTIPFTSPEGDIYLPEPRASSPPLTNSAGPLRRRGVIFPQSYHWQHRASHVDKYLMEPRSCSQSHGPQIKTELRNPTGALWSNFLFP